ncbi:hypothetical protein AcidC75_34320 [Acidisoma sp. C75]
MKPTVKGAASASRATRLAAVAAAPKIAARRVTGMLVIRITLLGLAGLAWMDAREFSKPCASGRATGSAAEALPCCAFLARNRRASAKPRPYLCPINTQMPILYAFRRHFPNFG